MELIQDDVSHVVKSAMCQPDSEFMEIASPVCTSTPNVERACPKLLDSIIPFPRIDDSGFGETLHLSPQVSSCCLKRDQVKFASTPLTGFPRLVFPNSACSSECLNEIDSPLFCTESEAELSPTSFQESGQGGHGRRSTGHFKPSDKFYEIWETEAENYEDEAYHSSPALDASSLHADLVESLHVTMALKHISLSMTNKLIGRRVGVEKVDIVGELDATGVDVITLLLPFLQPKDVCRMSQVCCLWRRLCFQHSKASDIQQKFLTPFTHKDTSGKENEISKDILRLQKQRAMTVSSGRLSEIQPTHPEPQQGASSLATIYSSSPSFLFEQTRRDLRWGENLRHCPKCHSVSKVLQGQNRGKCLSPQCEADFCTHCLAPYHHQGPCAPTSMKKTRTEAVGSKKSKKNLRRL